MMHFKNKHRAISKATGKNAVQQKFDVCALIDALEGMLWQYYGNNSDGLIYHDDLSDTEEVFVALGLENGMTLEEMQAVLVDIKRAVCKK